MEQKSKLFELGVVCGRFGHEHLGHTFLIDNCRILCKSTLVLVGSSQEAQTLRNPFSIDTRINIIKATYPNELEENFMVRGINDLTNEYDISYSWGKYVKSEVIAHKNKFADLMVYGNDECRDNWFAPDDIATTAELIIPRNNFPISATLIRGLLLIDDKKTWKSYTHPNIHKFYDELRTELLEVPEYLEIYNKLQETQIDIGNFKKIYKDYELEDKKKKIAELK